MLIDQLARPLASNPRVCARGAPGRADAATLDVGAGL
jgi:hypothetical protein